MGTVRQEIFTTATPAEAWDAIRDIGALHTRLVPGFVTDTRLEPGARIVTFGNGVVMREPIISVDDKSMRVAWTADTGFTSHYNGAVQVTSGKNFGACVAWTADFLPHEATQKMDELMKSAMEIMKKTLDNSHSGAQREVRCGEIKKNMDSI